MVELSTLGDLKDGSRKAVRSAIRKAIQDLETVYATNPISGNHRADEFEKIQYLRCVRIAVQLIAFESMAYTETQRARDRRLFREAEAIINRNATGHTSVPIHTSVHCWPGASRGYAGIQDLPVELLQYIFQCVTELQIEMRVTLGHVCRYWREATITCPALWTTISLDSKWTKGYLPLVQHAIEHAKLADLHLTIDLDYEAVWPYEIEDFHTLLRFVLASKLQWRTVRLSGPYHKQMRVALAEGLRGVDMPKLRAIEIYISDTGSDVLRALCRAASNLVSLKLDCCKITSPFPGFLPHVRSLELNNCSAHSRNSYAALLNIFPNILSLTSTMMTDIWPSEEYIDPFITVPLCNLRYLKLGVSDDELCSSTLSLFYCPGLRHLEIHTCHTWGTPSRTPSMFDKTFQIIVGNEWELESLDIGTLPYSRPGLHMLLNSLRQIRWLSLGNPDCEPFPILAEMSVSTYNCVLPALKELVIHMPCDPNLVLTWIETRRWNPSTRIERFATVVFPRCGNEHCIQWLEKLVELKQFLLYETPSIERR